MMSGDWCSDYERRVCVAHVLIQHPENRSLPFWPLNPTTPVRSAPSKGLSWAFHPPRIRFLPTGGPLLRHGSASKNKRRARTGQIAVPSFQLTLISPDSPPHSRSFSNPCCNVAQGLLCLEFALIKTTLGLLFHLKSYFRKKPTYPHCPT